MKTEERAGTLRPGESPQFLLLRNNFNDQNQKALMNLAICSAKCLDIPTKIGYNATNRTNVLI
jgi:hypothetical protein